MHYELPISIFDLKEILKSIQNSRYSVSIKKNNDNLLECASVCSFETETALTIHYQGLEEVTANLSLYDIEFIEFDSFFSYRAQSARRFVVA